MQVETFECQETAAEPIEATEEALGIIESLGLEGQKQLTAKPDGKHDTRCPYREMNPEERFVYGVLCPNKFSLKDYKASPIPLRVLQIAAHATSLGLFEGIQVWDRATVVEKDPVLVGMMKDKEAYWRGPTPYILARWGEVLETFSVLMQRALESKRSAVLRRLESVTSKAKMLLDNIDSLEPSELIEHGPEWLPDFPVKS